MDVFVANEQPVPVDEARLGALARHTLSAEDVDEEAELSVLVVASDHMRQLNARFAGNDYATDVLAFPMLEDDDEAVMIGDVVLCPDVAGSNAARHQHSVAEELEMLLVHGTLHLLGYDHHTAPERSRMEERTRVVLEGFRGAES